MECLKASGSVSDLVYTPHRWRCTSQRAGTRLLGSSGPLSKTALTLTTELRLRCEGTCTPHVPAQDLRNSLCADYATAECIAVEQEVFASADQVWVDSDGKVAYNGARVAGMSDPRGNSAEGPPSEAALMDQQWHMLTVSTQPDGVKGYRWAILNVTREI